MRTFFIFFCLVATSATLVAWHPTGFYQKSPDKAAMERGKKIYDTYCAACHQEDGLGMEGFNPPLVKTKWVLGDKPTLIRIVINGMDEEISIKGETYSRAMPANPHLKDDEIADVLTYVRNSFSNKASAVSVAEVKKQRAASK